MRSEVIHNEGFFRRWSRLKSGGEPQSSPSASPSVAAPVIKDENQAGAAVLPTLEDAARLTSASDYSAFLAQGVDKTVQRLALKKLFSDPHFNLMDGLDIYIADYTRANPVPASMLAALQQAQGFLQQVAVAQDHDKDKMDVRQNKQADDGVSQPPAGGVDE